MKAYGFVFAILSLAVASPVWAADLSNAATAGSVQQLQTLGQKVQQPPAATQTAPKRILGYQLDKDEDGVMGTYQPNGDTPTAPSSFFDNLGTNGRTCFTCHQPNSGWALSANSAADRFADDPADPLFRLIDGAVCPTADVSTPDKMRAAYTLVIDRGLIRIPMPILAGQHFTVSVTADPYGCNFNDDAGIATGILSFYRRPLPTANLNTLTAIMWDGREPNLFHQSIDATLGHAEATSEPNASEQQKIVSFEGCTNALTPQDPCNRVGEGEGVMAAQASDDSAGALDENGARGGPVSLYDALLYFSLAMNDPFGGSFNPNIFSLYDAWLKLTGTDDQTQKRQSIARGQQIFNTVKFNISGVAGLNGEGGRPATINGSCGTCHNTPNVGNNSLGLFMDIGVTAPGAPGLETSYLPVFTTTCTSDRSQKVVTDLGLAMVTGNCEDIGKTKVPVLRALPGRSPYFHNGVAGSIEALITFYNTRFNIGLSPQQQTDLAAFLESL